MYKNNRRRHETAPESLPGDPKCILKKTLFAPSMHEWARAPASARRGRKRSKSMNIQNPCLVDSYRKVVQGNWRGIGVFRRSTTLTALRWPESWVQARWPLCPPHCCSSPCSCFWKASQAWSTVCAGQSSHPAKSCCDRCGWRLTWSCSRSWWPRRACPWSWSRHGGCGSCRRTRRGWGWQRCWSKRRLWRLDGLSWQPWSQICCPAADRPPGGRRRWEWG